MAPLTESEILNFSLLEILYFGFGSLFYSAGFAVYFNLGKIII